MIKTTPVQNKELVLQAFETLFNKRDYNAAEQYWSSNYIQHSAHIPPGRDGLFNLIRSMPASLKYEPEQIVAESDYVLVHGRFSGTGKPRNWIVVDVVRVADGMLAEHWDVLEDEATKAESQSGLPMFGTTFPGERSEFAAPERVRSSSTGPLWLELDGDEAAETHALGAGEQRSGHYAPPHKQRSNTEHAG